MGICVGREKSNNDQYKSEMKMDDKNIIKLTKS
jgi:hypothetical protein